VYGISTYPFPFPSGESTRKGKDRPGAVRLGLERIDIERRGVVFDVSGNWSQSRLWLHGSGAKAGRFPLLQGSGLIDFAFSRNFDLD